MQTEAYVSRDTADRLIRIADLGDADAEFAANVRNGVFGQSVAILLSKESTPEAALIESKERVKAGEKIAPAVVEEIIECHKPAKTEHASGICKTCGCNEDNRCVNQDSGELCSWAAGEKKTFCTFCRDRGLALKDQAETPAPNVVKGRDILLAGSQIVACAEKDRQQKEREAWDASEIEISIKLLKHDGDERGRLVSMKISAGDEESVIYCRRFSEFYDGAYEDPAKFASLFPETIAEELIDLCQDLPIRLARIKAREEAERQKAAAASARKSKKKAKAMPAPVAVVNKAVEDGGKSEILQPSEKELQSIISACSDDELKVILATTSEDKPYPERVRIRQARDEYNRRNDCAPNEHGVYISNKGIQKFEYREGRAQVNVKILETPCGWIYASDYQTSQGGTGDPLTAHALTGSRAQAIFSAADKTRQALIERKPAVANEGKQIKAMVTWLDNLLVKECPDAAKASAKSGLDEAIARVKNEWWFTRLVERDPHKRNIASMSCIELAEIIDGKLKHVSNRTKEAAGLAIAFRIQCGTWDEPKPKIKIQKRKTKGENQDPYENLKSTVQNEWWFKHLLPEDLLMQLRGKAKTIGELGQIQIDEILAAKNTDIDTREAAEMMKAYLDKQQANLSAKITQRESRSTKWWANHKGPDGRKLDELSDDELVQVRDNRQNHNSMRAAALAACEHRGIKAKPNRKRGHAKPVQAQA